MWFVYVLQHNTTNEIYIGKTNDLKRRITEHNHGQQTSTKRKSGEWLFLYAEIYKNKQFADQRESRLKQHGRAKQELLKRIGKDPLTRN